jgi:hypothetical protein
LLWLLLWVEVLLSCCCYGEVGVAVTCGADAHAIAVGKVAAPAAAMVELLLQLLLDMLRLHLQ